MIIRSVAVSNELNRDILTASATEQALVGRMALQEQQIADALAP